MGKETRMIGGGGRRSAFTLMELLIVISIIAVLLSLLAPSMGRVKRMVRRIECGVNQNQLVLGWGQYAQNNRKWLPSSDTGYWPASWVNTDSFGNSPAGVMQGSVYKYVGAIEVYRCLSFPYDYYVTYGANSYLNGQHESASYRPGTIYKFDSIPNPGRTFVMVDEWDNRSQILGSFAPFQFGPYHWWDVVAGNHDNGDNLSFADGHVEYWQWKDPDTLTYAGGHFASDPGSVDCDRLRAAMFGEDVPHPE
jgi:prepilin-type N-terminal cleavage/methylation domain-containing protein/prepilin-type processing-associated H-X9-DG protein